MGEEWEPLRICSHKWPGKRGRTALNNGSGTMLVYQYRTKGILLTQDAVYQRLYDALGQETRWIMETPPPALVTFRGHISDTLLLSETCFYGAIVIGDGEGVTIRPYNVIGTLRILPGPNIGQRRDTSELHFISKDARWHNRIFDWQHDLFREFIKWCAYLFHTPVYAIEFEQESLPGV